ncbi:MAG: hypothetical protein PHW69_03090 [Elusimicrobiaceae bacterium]|nr:hypothetical protein [Elusimicrobiaceae bacterium]
MTGQLPVNVTEVPHWRVLIRPDLYRPERIKTLAECKNIIENTSVKLRGWHYPYVSSKLPERGHGLDWVASWTSDSGHLEYWRFYQSGQFLHLFSLRETMDQRWQSALKARMLKNCGPDQLRNLEAARGFISIENFIYRMTEIFEFAARLATQEIYKGSLYVEVELKGIGGFVLSSDSRDVWNRYYSAAENELGQNWKIACRDIISNSPHYALKACAWFFERFGWLPPAPEIIKREQEIFLSRSL